MCNKKDVDISGQEIEQGQSLTETILSFIDCLALNFSHEDFKPVTP